MIVIREFGPDRINVLGNGGTNILSKQIDDGGAPTLYNYCAVMSLWVEPVQGGDKYRAELLQFNDGFIGPPVPPAHRQVPLRSKDQATVISDN